MSCEHLICAQCAFPVVEGRCPVCRESRDRLHHHGFGGLSPMVIAVVLIVLLAFTLTIRHVYGG
ncbi:hypothetical protein ABGB17_28440 [Sphaerisporangium sp. B11E5]|uniref:hypothetical protein n=1 Tax=Sphaerisporangium sp. B11E5 TaxID=3153563 RepID=UPI00325C5180